MTKKAIKTAKRSTPEPAADPAGGPPAVPPDNPVPGTEAEDGGNPEPQPAPKPGKGRSKAAAIPGNSLVVLSKREGFRRAGFAFGADPVILNKASLTEAQIEAIRNEPQLLVSET